jgi:hypothetical protein
LNQEELKIDPKVLEVFGGDTRLKTLFHEICNNSEHKELFNEMFTQITLEIHYENLLNSFALYRKNINFLSTQMIKDFESEFLDYNLKGISDLERLRPLAKKLTTIIKAEKLDIVDTLSKLYSAFKNMALELIDTQKPDKKMVFKNLARHSSLKDTLIDFANHFIRHKEIFVSFYEGDMTGEKTPANFLSLVGDGERLKEKFTTRFDSAMDDFRVDDKCDRLRYLDNYIEHVFKEIDSKAQKNQNRVP